MTPMQFSTTIIFYNIQTKWQDLLDQSCPSKTLKDKNNNQKIFLPSYFVDQQQKNPVGMTLTTVKSIAFA
jgi:hypothetical protein